MRIRELAFELTCHLRPLANAILGGSSALHGTGMCFSAPVVRRYPWSESSVVEDGELSLRLIRDGHRIALATGVTVRQAVPQTFRQARSQAVRWERGRFDHVRQTVGLLERGARERDRNALLAAVGALIPPFTALVAGGALTLLLAVGLGSRPLIGLAVATLFCLLFYVLRGAALGHLGPRTLLRILIWAPPYTVWKVWVLALAASGVGRGQWTRTNRAA
jgi:cellulose synthase/poly-beta-1,6-N-acetylglucosamine synthase-like glycosyltransferase